MNNIINCPLAVEYKNLADRSLPDGDVYNYVRDRLTRVTTNQIRKVHDTVKSVSSRAKVAETDFETLKKELFVLVPLMAYATGRDRNVEPLYEFLKSHLTAKTITSKEDIIVFDSLFTNMVAYHKYFEKTGGNR